MQTVIDAQLLPLMVDAMLEVNNIFLSNCSMHVGLAGVSIEIIWQSF